MTRHAHSTADSRPYTIWATRFACDSALIRAPITAQPFHHLRTDPMTTKTPWFVIVKGKGYRTDVPAPGRAAGLGL
jgi:hypothetical protein